MLTVPTYATNCLTGAVMFPVLLVVAAIGIGRETDGMALSQVVAQFVPGGVYLACATGFLALTCTMGLAVSTAVSREGARHDMRRIYPVAGKVQLGAKLLMGMTFNLASALVERGGAVGAAARHVAGNAGRAGRIAGVFAAVVPHQPAVGRVSPQAEMETETEA